MKTKASPWITLVAASVLAIGGFSVLIRMLPKPAPLTPEGRRLFETLASPRVLVPLDSGTAALLPASPGASAEGRILIAFREGESVQVLSGDGSGIAWRADPSERKRYLHALVELAEAGEASSADLARQELGRLLGSAPLPRGAGPEGEWRLAMAQDLRREEPWSMLPLVERSALALSGMEQHRHMNLVSRAFDHTAALVRERFLPAPLAALVGAAGAEEGS